jgi:WD40 repeat protein
LIAVGTARYDSLDPEDWLPSVPEDLEQVVGLFCGQLGYRRALEEVSLNPASADLRAEVSGWLTSPDRSAEDVVVFYYSGHGLTHGGRHYLLTRDYREPNLVGTALASEDLVWMLGEDAAVQHLLVLLDTCYAGRGALDMGRVAAQVADLRVQATTARAGWWFLAAARPKDEAAQGAFAAALNEAVRHPRAGAQQRYMTLEDLVGQINAGFYQRGLAQQARLGTAESGGVPPFILNPDYIPHAQGGLDLASLAQLRQAREQDVTEHWDPRARGVALASDPGWYFSGRTRVLRELVAWLRDPDADHKARVVTGDPGSGKSAVLARLVTLADPKIRATAVLEGAAPGTIPPEGAISVAVHARNHTLGDLVTLLAAGLGVTASTPEELTAALTAQPRRRAVIIDALDEAIAPEEVADKLLRPLLDVASRAGLRLLLGTRRPLLDALGPKIRPLDLDDPAYLELADIVGYVTQVLLATHESGPPTPYQDQPQIAEQVAWAVARRANPTFLIARIVAHDLRTADQPLDPTIPGWEVGMPASVGHAFDAYLERFGPEEQRARDLLTPLAFAQGVGLPWEQLWAPLAGALADGQSYGDKDIRWLQRAAGAYLVEARDRDRSVYRLYHQTLAEHLRAQHAAGQAAQQCITQTLVDLVPPDAAGQRDWRAAHPYITVNLASHAAAAGLLDDLLLDPGFLMVADTDRLLPVLPTAAAPEVLKMADLYRAAVHRLRGRPVGEAAAHFELTARQFGHNGLADKVAELPFGQPWSVPWAKWASSNRPSRIVGAHDKDVTALALTIVNRHPVVVTGSSDSTVRIWDLTRGVPLGPPLTGHTGAVKALAVGVVNGRPVAVSGSDDHTVRVWDLSRGVQLRPPLTGHTGPIEAVAVTEIEGRPIAVTGSADTHVRVWDLTQNGAAGPALDERGSGFWPWRVRPGRTGSVTAVAVGQLDGHPIAVSGSDDGTVQIWDLEHGSSAGKLPENENGKLSRRLRRKVTAVALSELDGQLMAITAHTLEPKKARPHFVSECLQVWDLSRRALIAMSNPRDLRARMLAVGKLDDRLIALVSDGDHNVTVWDLSRQAPLGLLVGHTAPVRSMAVGELDGHPIAVTGSADRTVRVWDLTRITPVSPDASSEEKQKDELGEVRAVAAGEADGNPIVVTGGFQSARIWDARDGTEIAKLNGHFGPVEAVAVSELLKLAYVDYPYEVLSGWPADAKPVVATGGGDGTVRIWDLHGAQLDTWSPHHYPPNPLGFPRMGGLVWVTDSVRSIAVGELDDRPLVVIGSSDPYVRAWLIEYSWFPTVLTLTGHTDEVMAVAVGKLDGQPVAVTGSLDATVRVWNLGEGEPIGDPLTGHTGGIQAVAMGVLGGLPIAVTGSRDGTVRVWDLLRREPLGAPLTGHTGSVQAVAVGQLNGETMAISGSLDGTLRVWHIRSAASNAISLDSPVFALALGGSGRLVVGTVQGVLVLELRHAGGATERGSATAT